LGLRGLGYYVDRDERASKKRKRVHFAMPGRGLPGFK
jgi:hypothetical protein